MATPKIRSLLYLMLSAFGVGLTFIALLLLSQAAQNSENFDQLANSISVSYTHLRAHET